MTRPAEPPIRIIKEGHHPPIPDASSDPGYQLREGGLNAMPDWVADVVLVLLAVLFIGALVALVFLGRC